MFCMGSIQCEHTICVLRKNTDMELCASVWSCNKMCAKSYCCLSVLWLLLCTVWCLLAWITAFIFSLRCYFTILPYHNPSGSSTTPQLPLNLLTILASPQVNTILPLNAQPAKYDTYKCWIRRLRMHTNQRYMCTYTCMLHRKLECPLKLNSMASGQVHIS